MVIYISTTKSTEEYRVTQQLSERFNELFEEYGFHTMVVTDNIEKADVCVGIYCNENVFQTYNDLKEKKKEIEIIPFFKQQWDSDGVWVPFSTKIQMLIEQFENASIDCEIYETMEEFEKRLLERLLKQMPWDNIIEKNAKTKNEVLEMKANLYECVGILYADSECTEEAEQYYQKAIALCEDKEQENNIKMQEVLAGTCNDMALLYENMPQYDRAEEYYLKAIAICDRWAACDEGKHLYGCGGAVFRSNLASIYEQVALLEEAESYRIEALKRMEKLYLEHLSEYEEKYEAEIAENLMNLGFLCSQMEQYEKAESYQKKALKYYNKYHTETAEKRKGEIYRNLAYVYEHLKDLENCLKSLLNEVQIYTKLEKDYPDKYIYNLLLAYQNIGNYYLYNGYYKQSKEYLEKALSGYMQNSKEEKELYEPHVADAYCDIAILYFKMKDKDKFKEFMRKSYELASVYKDRNEKCRKIFESLDGKSKD